MTRKSFRIRGNTMRILLLTVAIFAAALATAAVVVDAALPAYKKAGTVAGNLKSIGSDTMNNEMALWAEGFRSY
jgi:phosphate transport system substrate-binding protein